jgi:biotin carboxyl carrier protein
MASGKRPGKRAYLLITLFAVLLVLFPFLFWYSTWFGRKLSDSEIDRYFADASKPRRAQHALVQLGERLSRRQDVSRWYPKVVEAAASPNHELRQTAAWLMGQDRKYAPFHEELARLLHDAEPMVRRNAALALAAFGDASARPELLSMLRPFTVLSPAAGAVKYRLQAGDFVNPGTLIGRVGEAEVRAPAPGEVRILGRPDGATVGTGDILADLGPDKNHVWEALRALYLVGTLEDANEVERFTRPVSGMPETVARQASLTLQEIRSRSAAR